MTTETRTVVLGTALFQLLLRLDRMVACYPTPADAPEWITAARTRAADQLNELLYDDEDLAAVVAKGDAA